MLEQLPKILEESRKQVERLLNSPLKLKAQVSEVVYPNAKYGALFSSVMSGDSALGLESAISAPRLWKSHSRLISARGLKTSEAVQGEAEAGFFSKSTDSISQILESQSGFTEQAQTLESTFAPSLRGGAQAFHTNKTEKVDSSGDSMDCHAAKAARNDDKGVDSMIAPPHYQHKPTNSIYLGDNLHILLSLILGDETTKSLRGKVDLIYIDPPFDSKADYKSKITLRADSTITKAPTILEQFAYSDTWHKGTISYLQMLTQSTTNN